MKASTAGSKGAFGTPQSRRRKGNAKTFRGGGAYTGGKSFENSVDVKRESHGNIRNETGLRARRDVWYIAARGYKGAHFATFPAELIEPCIKAGCPVGGVVCDPFCGSGTVGMVAKEKNLGYILIDLNPNYTDIAKVRCAVNENL